MKHGKYGVLTALTIAACLLSSANAAVISTPSQTGIDNPLTFSFSGLVPGSGNATFSVFAEGDLGYDANEFLTISIGPGGGLSTNFGNFFDSTAGFTSYACTGGYACIRGMVDIVVSEAMFNGWGPSIDVKLTPGSGVNGYPPNSAQVTLTYSESVPEPGTLALLGLGLAGLAATRRGKQ